MKTLQNYIDALRSANESLALVDDLAVSHIMRLPDIFNVRKIVDDENEVWDAVREVTSDALDKFISMREVEGERIMKEDVVSRLENITKMVGFIENRSPKVTEAYRNKPTNKLTEVLNDKNIDEQRILLKLLFSPKRVQLMKRFA